MANHVSFYKKVKKNASLKECIAHGCASGRNLVPRGLASFGLRQDQRTAGNELAGTNTKRTLSTSEMQSKVSGKPESNVQQAKGIAENPVHLLSYQRSCDH